MSGFRCPKGWTLVGTNANWYFDTETRHDKMRKLMKWNKVQRSTPYIKKPEDLAKKQEQIEAEFAARKKSYNDAKAAGKLWSKAKKAEMKAIKKAARVANRRAAASI